ncbi:RHS repeat-associated core domain-containing protein [Pseudomonas promysalinigenes]|uniref:RHS repeat-associated core domain-containing protein n=1 Tax=Pseudomonas promysalinigenes TaxID=485898 RepID=UPI00164850E6|nr:RHS repeat-associated core domain-containing protein [Pseudomonas promysalinigenes]QXI34079.1 RHS repeat-associated core domain-containing protein [Pseudomonas promysalinigenes]
MHGTLKATCIQGGGVSRAYSPYGAYRAIDGGCLAFTGQLFDSHVGGYHLGNGRRTYNPVLMRFHSPDSLSPFSTGGLNAYAYCAGDPVNRVDPSGASWLSHLITGVRVLSSTVTAGGAVLRTARNVVNRLESQHSGTLLVKPSFSQRVGNIAFAWTGVLGVGSAVAAPIQSGSVSNVLTSTSQRLGMSNVLGNIAGGLFSNSEAAQAVWRGVGRPGVSAGRVAWETVYEVTGARMAVEGATYLLHGARALGAGISAAYNAATDAWHSWSARQSSRAEPVTTISIRETSL